MSIREELKKLGADIKVGHILYKEDHYSMLSPLYIRMADPITLDRAIVLYTGTYGNFITSTKVSRLWKLIKASNTGRDPVVIWVDGKNLVETMTKEELDIYYELNR